MLRILLAALVPLILACAGPGSGLGPARRDVIVTVGADGALSPPEVSVLLGGTVQWRFARRTDAVVRTTGACDAAPFAVDDPLELTGPLPQAAAGVFVLSPADGTAVDPRVWANPGVSGVFLRLLWSRLQPGPDDWDFRTLDADLDRAVAAGKLVSLGVKAGDDGTPRWIFDRGVTRLHLVDSGPARASCGRAMDLGSPTDPAYQDRYFAVLRALAAHVRARADWFRSVAYVKPSGANLVSHENRLPKRCEPGCPCNPQIFAAAGYRPSGLYGFYAKQSALLAAEFPTKTLSYALIQDGFPAVNEDGEWETSAGRSSGPHALPYGTEQTDRILEAGREDLGVRWAVQHNGLQPAPAACPTRDRHPATRPYGDSASGCPNRWVLEQGALGQVTGFQTNKPARIGDREGLDAALGNAERDSDGVFVEIYEDLAEDPTIAAGGVLDPAGSGRTLAQWDQVLRERRTRGFPQLPPMSGDASWTWRAPAQAAEVRYAVPASCAGNPASRGVVHVVAN